MYGSVMQRLPPPSPQPRWVYRHQKHHVLCVIDPGEKADFAKQGTFLRCHLKCIEAKGTAKGSLVNFVYLFDEVSLMYDPTRRFFVGDITGNPTSSRDGLRPP